MAKKKTKVKLGVVKRLSIKDRLELPTILPKESNILELTLIRDIKNKIEISQSEAKRIGLKGVKVGEGKDALAWEDSKAKDKSIEFTTTEIEFLRATIADLDKQKKIQDYALEFCLKLRKEDIDSDG